ncbi:MAG: sulfatase-like hydrolase/transferase [Actinomycetaceae bacterium]|nr:sulfatase-like hydrolase/transferase [Actinomycetaceae bacterium]
MTTPAVPQVPNVLVLMTDQHRIDTIGALGNPYAHTPHLDALADEGFAFTHAFTPTAICTPARTSLLTGTAPFRHKVLANHEWNIGYTSDVTPDRWSYTQELRDNGYNVGIVGKFHAGETHLPDEFGMDDDSYEGAINPVLNEKYQAWLKENNFPPVRIEDEIKGTLPGGRPGHTLAGRLKQPLEATFERFITERSIARLRQYAQDYFEHGKPFSLDVHYFGPHLPYIIPDEWFDLIDPECVELSPSFGENFANKPPIQENYSVYWSTQCFTRDEWKKLTAVYWGYVAMIDHEIGLIREEVERLGLADSTSIFFTADHGEFTGCHRLNDKGPMMYDDIYRIPFFAHIPGVTHSGTNDAFVSLIDLPATVMDLTGCDSAKVIDGRSILDLIREGEIEDWRDDMVLEFHGHHFPLQQRGLRTRDFQLTISPESLNELYDLRTDPYQMVNVYDVPHYDEIRRDLAKNLYHQLVARGDDVFAKWMAAMTDFDIELTATAKSDYDVVETDD